MLSRAVLPLTRPSVLASAARVSALSAQHPRWYAKNKGKNSSNKIPKAKPAQPPQPPQGSAQQKEYASEQAEFETKADPADNQTVRITLLCTLNCTLS